MKVHRRVGLSRRSRKVNSGVRAYVFGKSPCFSKFYGEWNLKFPESGFFIITRTYAPQHWSGLGSKSAVFAPNLIFLPSALRNCVSALRFLARFARAEKQNLVLVVLEVLKVFY